MRMIRQFLWGLPRQTGFVWTAMGAFFMVASFGPLHPKGLPHAIIARGWYLIMLGIGLWALLRPKCPGNHGPVVSKSNLPSSDASIVEKATAVHLVGHCQICGRWVWPK